MTNGKFYQSAVPAVMVAGLAMLSACSGSNDPAAHQQPPTAQPSTPSPAADRVNAAEPFEALTEQAFDADQKTLQQLLEDARVTLAPVRGMLSEQTITAVDGRIVEIQTAIDALDRPQIALSSVEAYRELVSAYPPDLSVPVAVSLLDYAGFRIQADLKATPPRWDDADAAIRFALEQWTGLKPQITDPDVSANFDVALLALRDAVTDRDLPLAETTAVTELDLVDVLETYFRNQ